MLDPGRTVRVRSTLAASAALMICSCLVGAVPDAERVAKLESTSMSKSSAMINFNIETFSKYMESSPRSYGVFVYFSADSNICAPCGAMQKAVSRAAQEYRSLSNRAKARHPVFFAMMKLSSNDMSFLQRYRIERVPLLHYIGPRARPGPLTGPDAFDVQRQGFSRNALHKFVNDRVGARLPVVRGGYSQPFVATVRKLQPALLGLGAIGLSIVLRSGAYSMPLFWFSCVVVVYVFSVGGGHYSWIHDTPLYVVNRDGVFEFMTGGSRSQYAAEGFFVSATCVSISVLIIIIQEMPKLIKVKAVQSMAGFLLAVMTYLAISILLTLYHGKMPGYLKYNEI